MKDSNAIAVEPQPRNAALPADIRETLRCALEALDCCIQDSAELLSERAAQWGQRRKERHAAMAEALERHRAVAERLRAMLRA